MDAWKRKLLLLLIGALVLLGAFINPAAAEVLYSDKHGVRLEYTATDTGQFTTCSPAFADGPTYTTKKIKIWKVGLKITNGSGQRIKPKGSEIATMTVDPSQGINLDYCFYSTVGHLHKVDGHSDQHKFGFGLAWGVYAIAPGRTISNSTYMYLYEDAEPQLTRWYFDGYTFLEDKKNTPKESTQTAKRSPAASKPAEKTAASPSSRQPSRPRVSGPSGSLLLLIDVSGSMSGTKLSSAKRAAVDTIRKAIKNRTEIAVLAFEGDCTSPINNSIGFTRDEKQLVAFVNGLSAQGGTPLATALEATNRFMQQHKSAASKTQMILLLADGDDDCGGLDTVLRTLKQKNLLYRHETVGLEVSGAAQQQLQNIARQSGGKYHSATSQNLSQVFSDAVDLMQMLDMIGKFN